MTTKICKKCEVEKPLGDFYNEQRNKDGKRGICKSCDSKQSLQYRRDNKERVNAQQRGYSKRPEWKKRKAKNQKAYYLKNKEKLNQYYKEYAAKNPDKGAKNTAKYRAKKINATPEWANHDKIKEIYAEAAETGMHVDHIIPLQGKLVSGLHVEYNLQLLTPEENLSKSNKFTP
jgi:hypothetical protein